MNMSKPIDCGRPPFAEQAWAKRSGNTFAYIQKKRHRLMCRWRYTLLGIVSEQV